ncbi:MAG: hypothetical protein RJA07_1697 [Bacteroidota bacterium]|jgi:hypothetical protein
MFYPNGVVVFKANADLQFFISGAIVADIMIFSKCSKRKKQRNKNY